MTAFITPACARKPDFAKRWNRLLRLAAFLALSVFSAFSANANDAKLTHAEIVLSEEGYAFNADFAFELNSKLTDALLHGVALHFIAELRIERPRWYWFDVVVAQRRLEYRLSYHALTRSYRLNIGSLHRNFDTLADAVRTMQRIRNLHLLPQDGFDGKTSYEVNLRFFHDTAQLPKPFQLSALANGKWGIDTGWLKWFFTPDEISPKPAMPPEDEDDDVTEAGEEATAE